MSINVDLFCFINQGLKNPLFDCIMPVVTHLGGFKFLLAMLIVVIVYAHFKNKKVLKRVMILALIAFLFSDIIVAVLKHLINKPRPFVTLDIVNLLITEKDPFSFPSGHASSTLSVVTFLVLNMKELARKHYMIIDALLVAFAIVIMFSRIYVGVHYPVDVLGGALIGIFGALIVNHFKDSISKIIWK